jgi:signal peptidase I
VSEPETALEGPEATESGTTAAGERPEAEAGFQKSFNRDIVETLLICFVFVVFYRSFIFQQSKIPSGSMNDTLRSGDYIMVNRFVYADTSFDWEKKILPIRPIRRGDVVVFKFPMEPEVDFIKRVVGVPGDVVAVQQGHLFVNGEPIDEPYVNPDYFGPAAKSIAPQVVRPGHYFVMGDHRDQSKDSRMWGQVSRDLMKGRALLIWWSYPEKSSDGKMPFLQRLKSWGDKALHFATRSRWERCFKLIR